MKSVASFIAIIGLSVFIYFAAQRNGVFDEAYVSKEGESLPTIVPTHNSGNGNPSRSKPQSKPPSKPLPKYKIVADEIQDVPVKTQVELRIVIPEKPSKASLRQLLRSLFNKAKQRSGFKFRRHPSAVYIYAYGPNTVPDGSAWIGMVSFKRNGVDGTPDIDISETHFDAAYEKPRVKFGLTEDQRKKVYWEKVLNEDRAINAEEDGSAADYDRVWQRGNRKLMRKYKLTAKQLQDISVEAMMKGWPMPPSP